MDEYNKKIVIGILIALFFVACMALVIGGHRIIGWNGLLMQLAGLAGLILLLWLYNRQYK